MSNSKSDRIYHGITQGRSIGEYFRSLRRQIEPRADDFGRRIAGDLGYHPNTAYQFVLRFERGNVPERGFHSERAIALFHRYTSEIGIRPEVSNFIFETENKRIKAKRKTEQERNLQRFEHREEF